MLGFMEERYCGICSLLNSCRCLYWLGFQLSCGWISILINIMSWCSSHCRAIVLWKSAFHEDTFQYLQPSKATDWTSLTHISASVQERETNWGDVFYCYERTSLIECPTSLYNKVPLDSSSRTPLNAFFYHSQSLIIKDSFFFHFILSSLSLSL